MASSTPHDDYDDDDDNAYLQAIGDYKPGSITKIELENFMTHAKVEMMPGPRYVCLVLCCFFLLLCSSTCCCCCCADMRAHSSSTRLLVFLTDSTW